MALTLFNTREEYEAHIVELMKVEAAKPPKPPKTVPDVEYKIVGTDPATGKDIWMPVRIYLLNPDVDTLETFTREELRAVTPAKPDYRRFYENQWRKVEKAKERDAARAKKLRKKYPNVFKA